MSSHKLYVRYGVVSIKKQRKNYCKKFATISKTLSDDRLISVTNNPVRKKM